MNANALVDAIRSLSVTNDEGSTTYELAEAMGVSLGQVGYVIREAHRSGLLAIGWRDGVRRDGRRVRRMTPVYRLKETP